MIDTRLALITGADIPVEECRLIVHQPMLKEIALIGEYDCFSGLSLLIFDKRQLTQDENVLQTTTNFQIFMTAMQDSSLKDKREQVNKVLSLVVPDYKLVFLPQSILLTKGELTATIDDNNFEIFQNTLAEIFCVKQGASGAFNPKGKKAAAIADKLMKARQKVAKEKGTDNSSLLGTYMSSIAIAQQLSLRDLSNYTLFQLYDALERYQLWLAWDLNIRSRLAGGKPDDQPENWMKNIH